MLMDLEPEWDGRIAYLEDAILIFNRYSKAATCVCYELALFGSTVKKGQGADIDLIAIPDFGVATFPQNLLLELESVGFKKDVTMGSYGLGNDTNFLGYDISGCVVHIHIFKYTGV